MSNPWVKDGDYSVSNIIWSMILVLIVSVQFLIVVVLAASFFPIPTDPFIHTLFPRHLQLVFPKRDLLFYRLWVGFIMAAQTALLIIFNKRLNDPILGRQLRVFSLVEAGWLFLMVFAIFKYFVYGYPSAALHLLYFCLAGSMLSKIFWKELTEAAKGIYAYVIAHPKTIKILVDIIFPVVIIGLIFIPDLEAVVARMWIGDCLHHMDSTLMAQAWAYANGAILNVDIFAHYGLGMPIFIALLAKSIGHFTYEGVVGILVWSSIIYFILCYFFLRTWLKSLPLAIAGVLIAIKWQMFHPGDYPFIFTYPYSTVSRYFFDIFFLFLILQHIRQGRMYLLLTAGSVVGLSLFYVSDTGVYLTLAFIFYLTWLIIEGLSQKNSAWKELLRPVLISASLVPLTAFVLIYAFVGTHAFSNDFWGSMSEQIKLFLIGHGDLPIYKSLLEGDYCSSLIGFIIPLIYGGIFIAVVSLCFLKKINRQHIMAAVLCVYGLGLYHYYVCRSAATSYYSVCLPLVFVLCWLAHQWGRTLKVYQRQSWVMGILLLTVFALLTNQAYLSYPNRFNFSQNPIVAPNVKWPNKNLPFYFNNIPRSLSPSFRLPVNDLGDQNEDLRIETDFKSDDELKQYFESEFAFTEDARLIDRLSEPGQAVALISSFETRILMQANRKSLFYYFPIIDSRPMHMRMFPFTSLLSTHRLGITMDQLDQAKPEYVFMEKIMLAHQVPQVYEFLYPELLYILNYIDKHYQPYAYGKYLVALKRIAS